MTKALPPRALRWYCNPDSFDFETTADLSPGTEILAGPAVQEALEFGLQNRAKGANLYVRGLSGVGRLDFLEELIEKLQLSCPIKQDRCYVHNFAQPDRPRLITLPAGKARAVKKELHGLVDFVQNKLPNVLEEGHVQTRRTAIENRMDESIDDATKDFQEELLKAGLQLVTLQAGTVTQAALFPVLDGQPVPPEELATLVQQGKLSPEERVKMLEPIDKFQGRLEEVTTKVEEIRFEGTHEIEDLITRTTRRMLNKAARRILEKYPNEALDTFLHEVIEDIIENLVFEQEGEFEDPTWKYSLHIVLDNRSGNDCPVVVENHPTLSNLLGTIEQAYGHNGPRPSDYRCIRAGALLRADGGFLILDAQDILSESGAWRVLLRTLRTQQLEITPPEISNYGQGLSLKPEPIPIQVRVVLVGGHETYYLLDLAERDFSQLFKVLVDFDPDIEKNSESLRLYALLLARLQQEADLVPLDRTAVAALCEHGARIAAHRGKLTTRMDRIADIAREGDWLARRADAPTITGEDVRHAVQRTKERASLPSRRFQEEVMEGSLILQTEGRSIGQINGLAVMTAGPLTYGFPARITASIGPGRTGLLNIEENAEMSGSIHTKGFEILRGLLRYLLPVEHPLTFYASLAFEQNYGGIDGDSASGAELCCLMSVLTRVPLRQDLAMTGAIDQRGNIEAIGGANEKIEGFYDICKARGLTGEQGVLIPQANAGDLMLRHDVLADAEQGLFHVYPIARVHDALAILTGMEPGDLDEEYRYAPGTLLGEACLQAEILWRNSTRRLPPTP